MTLHLWAAHMAGMTTTLQPAAAAADGSIRAATAFVVRTSPAILVTDPGKLEKALNAILGLDLGTDAERLIRAEIREAIH